MFKKLLSKLSSFNFEFSMDIDSIGSFLLAAVVVMVLWITLVVSSVGAVGVFILNALFHLGLEYSALNFVLISIIYAAFGR